jgi:hypothetical protein
VCALRGAQVCQSDDGRVDLILKADHGVEIAWRMPALLARNLGRDLHRRGVLAARPLPMSPRKPCRGAVDLAAIAVIGLVVLLGGAAWKISRVKLFERGPSAAEIRQQTDALQVNRQAIDDAVAQALAAERAAHGEQSAQTRTGQSLVAATGTALGQAGAAAQADPAVRLAGRLNAKAGEALEQAVGPLTPAQAAWVAELVANATSASEARRAAAEQALTLSDRALAASASREEQRLREAAAAQAEAAQLSTINTQLRTKLDETLAEKDRVGGLLDTVLRWALYLGFGYVLAVWVLPLLGAVFPAVRPLATAVHAVVAPLGAKALAEAQALARDASAALHNVVKRVEEKAPQLSREVAEIKGEWITQNDGTAAAHDQALRDAHQI